MASGVILLPSIESVYITNSTRQISQILPALGPEWIRHTIQQRHPEHEVRVVYGDHARVKCLDDVLRPEDKFIGFSCTGLSFRPILPLVEEARRRGVPAIVGGTHARLMGDTIAAQVPGLEVVTGPGEQVVLDLLNGVPVDRIDGLLRPGRASKSKSDVPYELRPFLHTTTDYTPFFNAWGTSGVKLYRDEGADKLVAVRGINGCWKPKLCSFCTVQPIEPFDPDTRARYLVDERRSIIEHFGERVYILDCSDALPQQELLLAIAKHLKGGPYPRVHSGGMVWDLLNPDRFEAALAAGYDDFLVGLEGYARQHLHLAFKPKESIDMLLDLLERRRNTRARYFVSGIIGWAGECDKTLAEALQTIKRLLEYESVITIAVNFLMPMPGSSLHREMIEQGIIDRSDPCPDMHLAFARHVKRNCPDVSLDRLREFAMHVQTLDSRVIQVWGCDKDADGAPKPAYAQSV